MRIISETCDVKESLSLGQMTNVNGPFDECASDEEDEKNSLNESCVCVRVKCCVSGCWC